FSVFVLFVQAEDGIRGDLVTGVQTCALPISRRFRAAAHPPPTRGRGCAAARNRRAVGASDRFVGQLGERVLQREPASLASDEIQKLPVKPHRAWRAQTVAAAERSLRMLSVRRGIAADELQGAMSL